MQQDPRTHRSRKYLTFAVATIVVLFAGLTGSAEAFSTLNDPQLSEQRFIRTEPFQGSSTSVGDVEGMAYIDSDNLFWISDDNREKLYAVDRSSGSLVDVIDADDFFGVGASESQFEDLEALAWNGSSSMYAFSGNCCPGEPSVFRIKRYGYRDFRVHSFKTLPSGSDFSGAAYSPVGRLWVASGKTLQRYYYSTNSFGTSITLPIPSGKIQGMGFADDDLFVVTNDEVLYRIDWNTKQLVDCYNFDLTSYGVGDARAVDIVSDSVYVLDGDDGRSSSDPRLHALIEYKIVGGGDSSCSGGGGGGGGGGDSVTATPSEDSLVNSAKQSKNYGNYDQIRLKDNYEYRPYVGFDVSGVGGSVASATLRLYAVDGGPDAGDWYATSSFDENNITWSNAPSLNGNVLVNAGSVNSGSWIELDVTAAVSGNGSYYFGAIPGSTNTVRFSSKEGANAPQLVVTWN